jgi:tetratricopeptide (TPR) repeat protein
MPLVNRSGDPASDWLGPALAEVVGAELHAGGGPRLIPVEDVARMRRELGLTAASRLDGAASARVRADLHADYAVTGELVAGPARALRLILRFVDLSSGKTLAEADERGDEGEVATLAYRAGQRLRVGLGERMLDEHDGEVARAALPTKPDAVRAYGLGLFALQRGENADALRAFEEAGALDPQHAWSQMMVANAAKLLGLERRAREAAARAQTLVNGLDREQQLWIEALYRDLQHDYGRAIELYRALVSFFPERVEYALQLARAQARARRGADCRATLEALRRQPLSDPADPSIDNVEAWCFETGGDFGKERELAARGAKHAEERGARLLAATAQSLEGEALRNLGRLDEAMARQAAAQRTFHELGDPGGEARTLLLQGAILRARRQNAECKQRHEAALAIYRRTGNRSGELWALNNLAAVVEPQRARVLYGEARAIAIEAGDTTGRLNATLNLAILDATAGNVTAANVGFANALTIARELGNPAQEAMLLMNLCSNQQRAGDADAALASCERARALMQTGGNGNRAMLDVIEEGVLIDKGARGRAEATAREAVAQARLLRSPVVEALAETTLAQALRVGRRVSEAAQAVARARALLPTGADQEIEVLLGLESARVQAAAGNRAVREAAARSLEAAAERAQAAGLVLEEREARLARCEVTRAFDRCGGAVEALAREARAAGDLWIARKATALSKR